MTFKHIGFGQSEVMRSLERLAVKKGHFDPKPEELVDAAAYKVKNNNFVPSENLYSDLMRLAKGLRDRGMENYAVDIEHNAFLYKTAETHLYRAHDEDGDDVINFAHPDGNAKVFEAQQGLGEFETILTIQQRMLEVAMKQPSSSGGQVVVHHQHETVVEEEVAEVSEDDDGLEVVAALIKSAQSGLTLSELTRDNNQKKINESLSVLQGSLKSLRDSVQKSFPQLAQQIEKIAGSLNVQLGLDSSQYTNAIKLIQGSVAALDSLMQSVRQPADTNGQIVYATLASQIGEYKRIAQDEMTEIYKIVPGIVGQKITDAGRMVDHDKIAKALQFYDYAYNLWDIALRQYQAIGDEKDSSIAAKNLEESKNLVNLLNVSIKRNMSLFDLMGALKDKVTFNNEDGLVEHARKWALDTEHFAKTSGGLKQSSVKDHLKKSLAAPNDISITPTADKPLVRPVGMDKPFSAQPIPNAPITIQSPSAPQHAGVARPTNDERQAVAMMQQQMSELGVGLNKEAEVLAPKLGMTSSVIQQYAHNIIDTGIGTQNQFDGQWGPKTRNALLYTNNFTQAVKTLAVDPGENYLKLKPEEVITKAKANQQALAQLMQKLELGNYMKTVPPGFQKTQTFDRIPTSLQKDNIFEPEDVAGNIPVRSDTFNSLTDFYIFLEGLGVNIPATASYEEKITKLSQIIRSDPYSHKYDNQLNKIEPERSVGNITVQQYDDAIKWFYQRATHQEDALRNSNNPEEQQRKQSYTNAIRKLWNDWYRSPIRAGLLQNKTPSQAVITRMDLDPGLDDALKGRSTGFGGPPGTQPQSGAQNVSYRHPGGMQDGFGVGGKEEQPMALKYPPFTDSSGSVTNPIDLRQIAETWFPGSVQWFMRNMANTSMDKRQWQSGSPDELYRQYATKGFYYANQHPNEKGASAGVPELSQQWMMEHPGRRLPVYVWFNDICEHILQSLPVIMKNWKINLMSIQDPKISKQLEHLIQQNQYELGQWIDLLTAQQTESEMMMKRMHNES